MNEVIKCLVERRSCKKYLPQQVDEAALQEVLLAGTYAPSGKNRQAAKILVVQKPEDVAALQRLNAAVLGNPEGKPFYGAPTVLVVLAVLTRKERLSFKPIILVITPFALLSNRTMRAFMPMRWEFAVSWPTRLISTR